MPPEAGRMTGALGGIRVIDVSEGIAGGYCTKLLAGLGADVIKVERPGTGDLLRRTGPFPGDVPHLETSAEHLHLNAGKRSVTLDVTCATGGALLYQMLERADILIAGAGDLHASLAPHEMASRHPDLLHVSITPFGSDGPRAAWRATEIVEFALSGYMYLNGDPDREPIKLYGSQAELQAGLHAALGAVTALRARETGKAPGQHVDLAASEAASFLLAGAIQRETLMGRRHVRNGARPTTFAPNRLYPSTVRPCADGHVHVHCHNRFPDLISVLMQDPRLATQELLDEPIGHADEIDAMMDEWLAKRDRWEAVAEAQELRIPMTEVLDPREVLEDRLGQHTARGFFGEVEHPVAGLVVQPGAPVRMPASPWRVARAPLFGEHTADVLGELGLSPREIIVLSAAGVV